MDNIGSMAWTFINSPAGVTILATIGLAVLNKLLKEKPGLEKYMGAMISAVKMAEKAVPDEAPDAGLRRLDEALKTTLKVFEEMEKRKATPQEEAALKSQLSLVHAELESTGTV